MAKYSKPPTPEQPGKLDDEDLDINDMVAKKESFRKLSARLKRLTAGRRQTPSEILIREDRDGGHRQT